MVDKHNIAKEKSVMIKSFSNTDQRSLISQLIRSSDFLFPTVKLNCSYSSAGGTHHVFRNVANS
jgi:hypothetical protein